MRIDNPNINVSGSTTSGLKQNITKVTRNGYGEQLWIADGKLYCSKAQHGNVNYTSTPFSAAASGYSPSAFRRGIDQMWQVMFPPTETGNLVDADIYGLSAWALFDNGNLYTWGINTYGQLGLGDTTNRWTPNLSNTGVTKVYSHVSNSQRAPDYIRLYILKGGELYGCGYNGFYQLGDGTNVSKSVWTKITAAGTNPKSVWNLGSYTGCLIVQKSDNTIHICGYNGYGNLGNGNTSNITTLTNLSTAWNGGDSTMVIQDVEGGFGFNDGTQAENVNITMFLDNGTTSRIASSGANGYYTLGDGTQTQRTTPVVPTGFSGRVQKIIRLCDYPGSIYVLKTDGTLWNWGYNGYGMLGRGNTTDTGTPAQVLTGVANIYDHFTPGSGYGFRSQSPVVLKTDGTYWICGYNGFGQCADNTVTQRTTFVQMWFPKGVVIKHFGGHNSTTHGDTHFAVSTNDDIYCYGYNQLYSISLDINTDYYLPTIFAPAVLQR